MLKLKLQFFSDEDNSQPGVKTFTQEEVDKLLQEKEQGFKSQLARMKQKQAEPEKEPETDPETNSNDTSSFDINEIKAQILQEAKQEAKQEFENLRAEEKRKKEINNLKNMGIKEEEIEKYSAIKNSMNDDEFVEYLRFKKKPIANSVGVNPSRNDNKKGQAVSSDFISSIISGVVGTGE